MGSPAGAPISASATKLVGTVPLGKQLLGDEPVGESARFRAQTVTPALDLAQSVVASLDHTRVRDIEALVILKSDFKPDDCGQARLPVFGSLDRAFYRHGSVSARASRFFHARCGPPPRSHRLPP